LSGDNTIDTNLNKFSGVGAYASLAASKSPIISDTTDHLTSGDCGAGLLKRRAVTSNMTYDDIYSYGIVATGTTNYFLL